MNESQKPVAFVFNCDFNGLSIIQMLGRKGVKTYALDCRRNVGTFSKYSKFIKIDDPLILESGFINKLIELKRFCPKNTLLIPTNDHWALSIAKNRSSLSDHYALCVADYATVSLFLDKEKFGEWAPSLNLPTPRTYSITDELPQTVTYPVAVKAITRRTPGDHSNSSTKPRDADRLRFVICTDEHEVQKTVNHAKRLNVKVLLQEVVNGDSSNMHTIGIYANNGEIKRLFFGKKIRGYPPQFGDCITGESLPPNSEIIKLAQRIASSTKYTGIAEIELMRDSKTNKYKLIEINPRSWSWIGITEICNADLPWAAYQELSLGKHLIYKDNTKEPPARYTKFLQDLTNCLIWYRTTSHKHWTKSPRKLWAETSRNNVRFAEFSKDDPFPSIFAVFNWLKQNAIRIVNLASTVRQNPTPIRRS